MKTIAKDTEAERNVKVRARAKGSGNGRENTNMFYSVGHSPFYRGFK